MHMVELFIIHYIWINISLYYGAETRKLPNSWKVNVSFVQKPFYWFTTVWLQEIFIFCCWTIWAQGLKKT